MANNTVAEIQVSTAVSTGMVFWGPPGTALPTTATAAHAVGFINLGIVGEDGIAPTRDVSVDDVKDSNGATVRQVQSDFGKSYQATLLQVSNADVNKMVYGTTNVTVTAAGVSTGTLLAIQDKGVVSDLGVLLIETQDGLARHRRVAPVARVTSMTEGPLQGKQVRSYEVTWSEYPDSSGVYEYIYNNDGVFA